MKNYRIKFPAIDLDKEFEQLSNEISGEFVNEDTLRVSGRLARGTIHRWHLEPAFSLRAWNLLFQQPVEFYKPGTAGADKTFTIIFVLTPEHVNWQQIGAHRQYSRPGTRSTLMIADSVPMDLEILPNFPVQWIDMNVSAFWLAQQFQKADLPLEALWDKLNADSKPLVLIEPGSVTDNISVNTLFESAINQQTEPSQIRSMAIKLITGFMTHALRHRVQGVPATHDVHFEKIMEAEAILKAHLQKTLPNLNAIAHQVALSESTLKRHFKNVFGKSVYEYYLDKKMQLAKNLLLEKPLTVNEAAVMLGYEKVSNFIDIFKKHHGMSPGSVKKKGFQSL
ncbi:helix-turn-helix transcriptional regulator [Pseudoflavitalea sp. G-6-1-2]|uniref:helix-turn-helix transcriptional regulator n=1 Tax=Pseudoflavitalea sp. G-6-1-2 TaxID=2728841 RepID=UPI00146D3D3F|nr:AraC family transcriptional regulator [Pseudoflavitalea sp. G-6-1-2]NML20305.1 helix-turn-helix transcriptional regulator [Pseudoflavitalea sp. G-6-1-2]